MFAFVYLGLMFGFIMALRREHSAWMVLAVLAVTKSVLYLPLYVACYVIWLALAALEVRLAGAVGACVSEVAADVMFE